MSNLGPATACAEGNQRGEVLRQQAGSLALHRDSSRRPMPTTLHAWLGVGQVSQSPGTLLRIHVSPLLPQADPHLDEPGQGEMAAPGHDGNRALLRQMHGGGDVSGREVDAQVQDSAGQQTGQGWYGASRQQTDDAKDAAPGDTEGGGYGMTDGGGRRQGRYRDGIS